MLKIDLQYEWQNFQSDYQAQISSGITTLLGGSGEGKSTLLQLLGGFLKGKGKIQYNDDFLHTLPAYERPISTLFQSDNLFPQLTVRQNVAVGVSPSLKLTASQNQKIDWALDKVGLSDKENVLPESLSGGQAQRVAIARVLVRNQPILLLDEPFSALDPALRESMVKLIGDLTQELSLTTLLVSHLPQEALLVGGRVLLIEKGRVAAHQAVSVLESADERHPAFSGYFSGRF